MEHVGGCFCNAIRYRASGKPTAVAHCHCSMCRRTSGAPVVTWAVFPTAKFAITKGEPTRLASSAHAVRTFCGTCGTPLTFQDTARPETIDVTVGSMDHPNNFAPQVHIWTSSQVSWLKVDEHLPRLPRGSDDGG